MKKILFVSILCLLSIFSFGKSFIWEVKDIDSKVYMMGSIHLGKEDMYPLPEKAEEFFYKADAIAFEVDILGQDQTEMNKMVLDRAVYKDGETLSKNISRTNLAYVKEGIEKNGMNFEGVQQNKPWFIATMLSEMATMKLGYSPMLGIDMYFNKRAYQEGKKILELENIEFQFDLFTSMTDKEEELYLVETLKDLDNIEVKLGEMMTAWRTGNTQLMYNTALKEMKESKEMKNIYDSIYLKRNINMTNKIMEYLSNNEEVFVIVGAAHFAGDEGIVGLLEKMGYEVKQW